MVWRGSRGPSENPLKTPLKKDVSDSSTTSVEYKIKTTNEK